MIRKTPLVFLRGSALAERILHDFSRFRGKKVLTEKRTEKRTEERTEKCTEKRNVFTEFFHRIFPRKTECFHRFFSTEIFPNFRGVFFSAVRTVNATEKRPPKGSARKSTAAQSKIQSANVATVEASQHARVRSKHYPEKTENFFSSQFCTSLPSNCFSIIRKTTPERVPQEAKTTPQNKQKTNKLP